MIRVLLADDQPLVRAGFAMILGAEDHIEVVGEADDAAAAVELARTCVPDVVFMDIRMPGMDEPEATRRIAADDALAAVRILVLTTFELDEYVFEALLSPSVTRRLIAESIARPVRAVLVPPSMVLLTERERENRRAGGAGPHQRRDRS